MRGTALDSIGATGGITGSCMLAIVTHAHWPTVFDCGSRTAVPANGASEASTSPSGELWDDQNAIRRERSEQ
jgi:hypothetical protein